MRQADGAEAQKYLVFGRTRVQLLLQCAAHEGRQERMTRSSIRGLTRYEMQCVAG